MKHALSVRWLAGCVAVSCLLVSARAGAGADNWTRFRGPNGTGLSEEKGIPVTFTESDYLWKTAIPGLGHSAPVIWADRVFVTSALDEGTVRSVVCLSADSGEIRWQTRLHSASFKKHPKNSYASATPACDGERLYVAFNTEDKYTLAALDLAGKIVWERDLGTFTSQHGSGTSPIVFEDLVILANDQDGDSFLVACDRKTGAIRWKTPRRGAPESTSYSTPFLLERPGHDPELIFLSKNDGLAGVDARTGRVNWQTEPFPMRCVGSPVYAQGLIIGACGGGGQGKFLAAVPSDKKGQLGEKDLAWTRTRQLPYVPTPIVYGEHLFLWTDQGVVSCVEPKTGNNLWTERVTPDGPPTVFSGSPICIDGKLYCVNERGIVFVVEAGTEFKLLGQSSIGESSYSTPAVANGRLYIRGFEHLICIGKKKPAAPAGN
jgi:outer membrane protein assembly factor BamB